MIDVLKYLQPNAAVPIDMETTAMLVNALRQHIQRSKGEHMTDTCERHCEAKAFKIVISDLEHDVVKLKSERDKIYALLGSAHLELRQNLEYGYNRNTIKSTLISVGQYAPKLKAKMDELQAKLKEKNT